MARKTVRLGRHGTRRGYCGRLGLVSLITLASGSWLHAAGERHNTTRKPKGSSDHIALGPALTLVWCDPYRLFPPALQVMWPEVERIFGELGVEVHWRDGDPDAGVANDSQALELRVVLLPVDPTAWGLKEWTMGAVLGGSTPRGSLYIFFPSVVRTAGIGLGGISITEPTGMRQMGRALARVLSHEMVHAVAPSHPHAGSGIMSEQLTRRLLLEPGVGFDRTTGAVFSVAPQTALAARILQANVASGQ